MKESEAKEKLMNIACKLHDLQIKVDSGRHTMADILVLRETLARYEILADFINKGIFE